MQIIRIARTVFHAIWASRLLGEKYYCPLCQTSYSRFLPAGNPSRPNVRCPGCGSLERHRLLWESLTFLQKQGEIVASGNLLHVAPENCLTKILHRNYDYISVDMCSPQAQVRTDVTALCFPDEFFDAIICNHVLEHVPDDRKALSELFRVLKHGGWGSIQVPLAGKITHEDLSIIDPMERERLYGQSDHVRQYGEDFKERLQAAGFDILELPKEDLLAPTDLKRLAVTCEKSVILVRKHHAGKMTSLLRVNDA